MIADENEGINTTTEDLNDRGAEGFPENGAVLGGATQSPDQDPRIAQVAQGYYPEENPVWIRRQALDYAIASLQGRPYSVGELISSADRIAGYIQNGRKVSE